MPPDPIGKFGTWFARARRAGEPQPEAMALATSDPRGKPSVRFVLLKHVDRRGFVFFTDRRSRKGRELRNNPRAAAVLYWPRLGRQVRLEGRVEPVSSDEADRYWRTRPKTSQIAASVSRQSRRLASRTELLQEWRRLRKRFARTEVPRPAYWTGFRLVPETIEFWTHRAHRLHHRECFVRSPSGWKSFLLQP
ncbi:MAG: pyridoxine/pyridoxamine 5'-phosphate oxidase [Candidatus Binatia bacterium]|nr:MAG: pyridoxine/pyridoxamine 5'-phosphate oxidase [Candidatus Binatia bacterium]